ncbi:hypothetical protein [Rheinheimera sp. F8]|uniref:hypothetical protein n=1 Tax=Rheinheimera sp. F8 TaxID=1763998 RepID=UPI000744BA9E|nr:hypothetical protein [Rheinheimera sp. F8]ALZ75636.1 hypothetical protein ATY27_07615 [Rheinheimera sp. F8]
MCSAKALKKKIAKRAKQKKNIQVKNSIRLKHKANAEADVAATAVESEQVASSDNIAVTTEA